MIRRDIITAEGRPAWLLVPQIAHAELAGNLADVWQFEGLRSVEIAGDLRMAVHRHDDGWREWDARPGVEPKLGRPVNFDEMRLADSLAIWTRSILQAAARGPLVGYFVAGHFTRLLRRFDSWRNDSAMERLAREFLAREDANMSHWLADWQESASARAGGRGKPAIGPGPAGAGFAQRGVSYLQLFDAISLWLCCAERHEPWRVELAAGESWTFSPVGSAAQDCQGVRIDPWPLTAPERALAVRGRLVPQAEYRSTDELLSATIAPDATLSWRLMR